MSSHFNYEINEARLRERLTKLENPGNDDSWKTFQDYLKEHPLSQKRTVIPAFRINLNRNLILPFVFGTVIVAFSLLLFNFVIIKKKSDLKTSEIKPKQAEEVHAAITKTLETVPEIKQDTIAVKTETVSTPALPTIEAVVSQTINTVTEPASTPSVSIAPGEQIEYISISEGNIFVSPNKASEVIGNFASGKGFYSIEETIYFIKVNTGGNTGFIMKSQVAKRGASTRSGYTAKKSKKAEVLQSNQTPFKTASEEKEPELK